MTQHREVAFEVHPDDVVPIFFTHGHQHLVAQETGVVDQDVQCPEGFDGRVHQVLRTGPVGHVVTVDNCLATRRLDLCDNLFGRALAGGRPVEPRADVVHHDLGAFARIGERVFATDPPSGTGHDDHSAGHDSTHQFAPRSSCCVGKYVKTLAREQSCPRSRRPGKPVSRRHRARPPSTRSRTRPAGR